MILYLYQTLLIVTIQYFTTVYLRLQYNYWLLSGRWVR